MPWKNILLCRVNPYTYLLTGFPTNWLMEPCPSSMLSRLLWDVVTRSGKRIEVKVRVAIGGKLPLKDCKQCCWLVTGVAKWQLLVGTAVEVVDHLGSCMTGYAVNTGVWIVEIVFAGAGRIFAKLTSCGGSAMSPHGNTCRATVSDRLPE